MKRGRSDSEYRDGGGTIETGRITVRQSGTACSAERRMSLTDENRIYGYDPIENRTAAHFEACPGCSFTHIRTRGACSWMRATGVIGVFRNDGSVRLSHRRGSDRFQRARHRALRIHDRSHHCTKRQVLHQQPNHHNPNVAFLDTCCHCAILSGQVSPATPLFPFLPRTRTDSYQRLGCSVPSIFIPCSCRSASFRGHLPDRHSILDL